MNGSSRVLLLLVLSAMAACSGDMRVVYPKGSQLPGIPIVTSELWVLDMQYTITSKGGACDSSTTLAEV